MEKTNEEYELLRQALLDYYEGGKVGAINDHLPVGAEMVDSRYIVYKGRRERLDQWCRMLDVYNAPKSYNVRGNYQSRVTSSKSNILALGSTKNTRRPLSNCTDEELVTLAQKTAERFFKAIDEAKKIGSEYGIVISVSDENNLLNTIFAKLKERRDTVTKESVEADMQIAIGRLALKGDYETLSKLTQLFGEGKFKEVRNLLQSL